MRQFFSSARGISIIPLLIGIMLVSVAFSFIKTSITEARVEGRNEARLRAVAGYIRALDVMRADSNAYPVLEAACLGDYEDDRCWLLDIDQKGEVSENARFGAQLRSLVELHSPNVVRGARAGKETAYEGMIYRAIKGGASYEIEWMLEGAGAVCEIGEKMTQQLERFDITHCVYTHRP